ncbi:hypothetical protein PIB30_098267 [Stylosanthes scabra]|uniref:Uncharacterized protein n=1 Tax=Stylosanthes scabra TaxID=79078 RepID=A0ABU6RX02_9FABA|nr:hypothetical protein [Stylosanthes scabra]
MEDKVSALSGDQSTSASGDSCRSSAGGEWNRRRRKFVAPRCRYFSWLDDYMSSFVANEVVNKAEVSEDMVKLEEKIAALEKMVAERTVGSRGSTTNKCWGFVFSC